MSALDGAHGADADGICEQHRAQPRLRDRINEVVFGLAEPVALRDALARAIDAVNG